MTFAEDEYEKLPEGTSTSSHLVAGAAAGIMEHCIMYPIDIVKTRMQVLNPSPAAIYSGITHAFGRIVSAEGVISLWRGVNSVAFGAGPAHAIYFATYEKLKEMLGGHDHRYQPLVHGFSGAMATVASDAIMNPFDVVKQRLQVFGSRYRGVFHCAKTVLRTEGLTAFYISYPTTLMMTIPFQSVHFATYEYFRERLNPRGGYDPKTHIIAGGLAGTIASACTTPLDVAKTLLQTKGDSSDSLIRQCRGMTHAFTIIYKHHGLFGFFKGIRPRVLSHMPATAICWSTYEYFKWFLSGNQSLVAEKTAHSGSSAKMSKEHVNALDPHILSSPTLDFSIASAASLTGSTLSDFHIHHSKIHDSPFLNCLQPPSHHLASND